MKRRTVALPVLALSLLLAGCAAGSNPEDTRSTGPQASASQPSTRRPGADSRPVVAPYLYVDQSGTPDPVTVMEETGLQWFSLAFVLSDGGCTPVWAGQTGLGGRPAHLVEALHRAGGHVVVSVGGAQGAKLGLQCPDAQSLAAAYQEVIDAYRLEAIDLDIEHAEFTNARVQDRVLRALAIVGRDNPDVTVSVTVPATPDGLDRWGQRMVRRAAELEATVDVWAIMPFNFGTPLGDAEMGGLAIRATERTHHQLATVHPGLSDAAVYGMQGIVLMNGTTDTGETVRPDDFRQVRDFAVRRGIARLAFWSLNRDRPCHGSRSRSASTCSGVQQRQWQFSELLRGASSAARS